MAALDNVDVGRYADMFAAMGAEPRLRIMRLLLSAHPRGLVVGDIQGGLGIAASTLSHHLEKLKIEELVTVAREGTFLRYRANVDTLTNLLAFLYQECCSCSDAISADAVISLGRKSC
jgi:DNA-binding transcriptional ArsR family regulator